MFFIPPPTKVLKFLFCLLKKYALRLYTNLHYSLASLQVKFYENRGTSVSFPFTV